MSPTVTTGEVDFVYNGESFKTWYKVFGDLHSGATPLVVLHGGPGVPHNYVLPHARLAAERGIPVVFYDQVGCGQSTHRTDKPAAFWAIPLFVAELDNLLSALGIAGGFDLLGHSWGGILAAEFAATTQPRGLRRLILADSLASMALWEVSVGKLLGRMPQGVQEVIKRHEAAGTTDSVEYQEAMQAFYREYVCRLDPWPQDLLDAFAALEKNSVVYQAMQGPSEFTVTGSLKTWSIVDRLHTITAPTLVINSVYDEAQDECVGPLFQKIPKSKWVQFAKSAHMPFFDEQDRYIQVVGDFLLEA